MSVIIGALMLLFSVSSWADDPLTHFNWKSEIKAPYPKPWVQYIRAFINDFHSFIGDTRKKYNAKLDLVKVLQISIYAINTID